MGCGSTYLHIEVQELHGGPKTTRFFFQDYTYAEYLFVHFNIRAWHTRIEKFASIVQERQRWPRNKEGFSSFSPVVLKTYCLSIFSYIALSFEETTKKEFHTSNWYPSYAQPKETCKIRVEIENCVHSAIWKCCHWAIVPVCI